MKTEFDLKLPEIGDLTDFNVESFFKSVSEVISSNPDWKVESNEISLGFFSFGKFLMYKDVDTKNWPEDTAPGMKILSALLLDGFREPESVYSDSVNIDKISSPSNLFHIKDADSTQVLAILDVKSGKNIVLQGPPGTGKSQTITNIIAECIGSGQTVLFVSEKMAALEVVKRRLDEASLGDAVLELHSHKTNKKSVLNEIERTLHQGRPLIDGTEDDIKTLEMTREKLNGYCSAVNDPIGRTRTSFISALGKSIKFNNNIEQVPTFEFHFMAEWTELDYKTARMKVERLDRYLTEFGAVSKNYFNASLLTELLPSQKPRLEDAIVQAKLFTDKLLKDSVGISNLIPLKSPESTQDIETMCQNIKRIIEAPIQSGLQFDYDIWKSRFEDILQLIDSGEKINELHFKYDIWLADNAWDIDVDKIRQSYIKYEQKKWRFLSKEYRCSKVELKSLFKKPLPKTIKQCIEIMTAILDFQKYHKIYEDLFSLGKSIFCDNWKGEQSDWNSFKIFTEWLKKISHDVEMNVFPKAMLNYISKPSQLNEVKEKIEKVDFLLKQHADASSKVADLLKLNIKDNAKTHWNVKLKMQSNFLEYWRANFEKLNQIINYNQISNDMKESGLDFVVEKTSKWDQSSISLLNSFDYSWHNGLVEKAYLESQHIKTFDRSQHDSVVADFSRLDRQLFQHNKTKLALKHWENIPTLNNSGELHIISREINKKRRHLPIRKLIEGAGRAIQSMKPIFMMSPMSIATYIPSSSLKFDVVIFDEASQVKPVDAFGAIMRGKQIVVVGDSKQLPPTNFFETLTDITDEEELDNVGDMESILSLFLAKGSPERMLRWHYRSRHESLIAVSNYEFYENKLVIFPSSGINQLAKGLSLICLPETSYDRGKSRTNVGEAKYVAKSIMEHALQNPEVSLGVVAFSVAQRDAIELQLELLRRNDPSRESFFNSNNKEPFFIKNLENVQGDERDVIFISIGYGKTEEGNMTMSFGPLNREGGERRLNVLISRARLEMKVFSNFKSNEIDTGRTNSRGVLSLKKFLAYAETRILEQPYSTKKEPDSPFEEAVINALLEKGIGIEPQVGTAGFFIDIGVKDSEKKGQYILGIECDGATYHSSRSARDRDRLRQEILEGLGWRLHRIWSTAWYKNPKYEIERVISAIENAKKEFDNANIKNTSAQQNNINNDVRREEVSRQDNEFEETTVPYNISDFDIDEFGYELHELPVLTLLKYVKRVVDHESPIHQMEVLRRITQGAGLSRSGNRIQDAVNNAISLGVRQNQIAKRKDFLWQPDMKEPPLRDRTNIDNSSRKIEFVAPEEIQIAILKVVKSSFSASMEDVASNAARMIGFQRITSQMSTIIEKEIKALIKNNKLSEKEGIIKVMITE